MQIHFSFLFRFQLLWLLYVLVPGMSLSAGPVAKLSRAERVFLQKNSPLVFVCQTSYPPFEFVDRYGEHTGMTIELLRWMATELEFKARFTNTSFQEAQEMVLSGAADVLTSFFYSKKRDELFDFTNVLFEVPASIFVATERPDIKSMADLDGKIIAMQKGDYALEFLKSKGTSFSVVDTSNFAEATDQVIDGLADAIIGDEQIVMYHLYSHRLMQRVKKVGEPLYVGQDCMGVREGNRVLQGILNKGIQLARETGALDRIHRKWLGTKITSRQAFFDKYGYYTLAALAGMFLLALFVWIANIRLRKQVLNRTRQLTESEETLRSILSATPIGIGILENDRLAWHNDAMTGMIGYRPEEARERPLESFFQNKATGEEVSRAVASRNLLEAEKLRETIWQRKDGTVFDARIWCAFIKTKKQANQAVMIAEDITDRKRAAAELVLERHRLANIIHGTNVGTWEWNVSTGEVVFNERWAEIVGYSLEEISPVSIETWQSFAHPDDLEISNDLLGRHFRGESDYYECEVRMKHRNGEWVWVMDRGRVASRDEDGKPLLMSGTHQDITSQKQVEQQIRNSLREKEILLQEIHHRVKNNLAVVSSLLNLQALKSDSEDLKSALTDSQNRIRSMSTIHETLYESRDLSSIDLKEYVAKLARYTVYNYITVNSIELDIRVESVTVDVNQASPLGLVINELVSNSAKHAFPDGRKGRISIRLKQIDENRIELIYGDDGVGLPEDFDWRTSESMGMNLIRILTEGQLKGTIEKTDEPGTCFVIRF